MAAARFPVALVFACLVTFGLFWAMQALVSVQGELREGASVSSIDFVRLKRDTAPETKKRAPPKREKPKAPPPPPDMAMTQSAFDPGDGAGTIQPEIDPTGDIGGGIGAGAGADRGAVPLVRIEPDYPLRARQRGIEGWVAIEFTISAAGTVSEAVVIRSHPGSIFDSAAIAAVRKWKYQPQIVNGQPVARPGQRITLEFTME